VIEAQVEQVEQVDAPAPDAPETPTPDATPEEKTD
jgi:hypothetical protein